MVLTVEMRRRWDQNLLQTAETVPNGSHSRLLLWSAEPAPIDSGAPRDIAKAIARVLTDLGEVAFRWSGDPAWPPDEAQVIAAPERNRLARARDWLTTSWPTDIVVTRSISATLQLFEHEWEMQGQVALVLDPQGDSREPAYAALRDRRDWRNFALAPPVLALLAPAVDGDGAQFSVGSENEAEDLVRRLNIAFGEYGIDFRSQ